MLLHRPLRCPDVAIDLGTANTRLFAAGRGLLAEAPSIVGKSFHPLRRGVIVDIGGAAELLEPMMRRARGLVGRPRALACIPTNASEDERWALRQAARAAGASDVAITSEPLAAAIGAGLDLSTPWAQMIVDLGDGVTDIAVIRSGEVIESAALRIGCGDFAAATADSKPVVLEQITTFITDFVRDLSSSAAVEVIENGLTMTGGGANIRAIVDSIRSSSALDIHLPADPLHAVIHGAGRMIAGPGARLLWRAASC